MAEQLGFHQVLGDRRHVQRDEWRGCARAVAMQGMGDQLLAGTRFAVDQHGDVGMAEAADGAEYLLHRRRLADDLRRARLVRRQLQALLLLGVLVGALDQGDRLVDVERRAGIRRRRPGREATALSRSECAVMMITGRRGCSSRICASRSRPLAPGMRISEMITSGCCRPRRPMTLSALSKLTVVMPSCCRAFSSTQRMERSSSTIQTVSDRLMVNALLVPGAGTD